MSDAEILAIITSSKGGALAAFNAGFHDGWVGVEPPSRAELVMRYDDPSQYRNAYAAGRKAFSEIA